MNTKKNCHIKKGDTIKIISGSNKGFIGKIGSIIFKTSTVFIEGIPPRVKYSKNSQNTEGKKIELQIPIHISNVMLWDKLSNSSSKIGYKIIENKKYRYFKKSGNLIENQKI
jgi:large subunit ribosomal protein L24